MIVSKAVKVVGNPHRRSRRRAAANKSQRRSVRTATRNPHVLTLGTLALNPQRRTMAKRKRTIKARAVAHGRRTVRTNLGRSPAKPGGGRYMNLRQGRTAARNPRTRIIVRGPQLRRTASNPMFFGRQMKIAEMGKVIAGGLVGVGVTKMIVPMLPATLISNPLAKGATAIVVAIAAGWGAGKVSPEFGSAVLFGGLMEAASEILSPYIPISQYTGLSGGRGLRAYVPAQFNEPQNPFGQLPTSAGRQVTSVYRSPYSSRLAA